MAQIIQNVLQGSVLCRALAAVGRWLGRQWRDSRIVTAFLSPPGGAEQSTGSIFYKLWKLLHRLLCRIFSALRLDRLLEGSVFRREWFWCTLAAVAAPILPTMAVLGLAMLGLVSMALNFACDRERELVYTPVDRYILLLAAIYVAAVFLSVTVRGSLEGGVLTAFFVGWSLVLLNAVHTKKELDRLVLLLVCAGVAVSLYGCAQYVLGVTGAAAWVDSDMFSSITTRVYATLQNPNVLAEYLLLVIPFAAAGVMTARRWWGRVLYVLAFGVMCVCMLLTMSRGGWLGLLFAGAVFLVLIDRRFILLGLVALAALYFVLPETVIERFTSIGDLSDGSTSYRLSIWLGTVSMLKDYWLCGVGPGVAAFNMVYPAYSFNSVAAPHAHNLFLQIMCDCGVCGLVVFLIILFLFFRVTCGALSRETDRVSRYGLIAAISAMCGFLVQSMTDHSFYNYRVLLLFWIFTAVGLLYARRTGMREGGGAS